MSSIKGSDLDGRTTKKGTKAKLSTHQSTAQRKPLMKPKFDLYGYVERVPLTELRRATAKRMVGSQHKSAHVTAMDVVDVTELCNTLLNHKKSIMEDNNIMITYLPLIMKSVIEALKLSPVLNSTYNEDSEEIIIKKYYNIGFTVNTEDELLIPVIKGADQKGIKELSDEIKELTDLATTKQINSADLDGSTFTIINYGVFGGIYCTPIINYPEVAILGIGRIMDVPMVKDGEIKIRKALHLSLSFDYRVLNYAEAALFLNTLKSNLESPNTLLV